MSETAHTYTPKDNSIGARVQAYRTVVRDYKNAEASLKHLDDQQWANRLGSEDEVRDAYNICLNSMKKAADAVKLSDLKEAEDLGLLSSDEATELTQIMRQAEMTQFRKKTSSNQNSQKR